MAGFDAITNQIGLILFPLALDFLLWFGPHLRLRTLIAGMVDQLFALPVGGAPDTQEAVRLSREFWLLVADQLNLLVSLRSYPVGIPSLMASRMPAETPLGLPPVWEVPSVAAGIGIWIGLSLLGLVTGALYFNVVSQAALDKKIDWGQALAQWPWSAMQIVLLAVFWVVLLVGLSIPASCLLTVVLISGVFGQFSLIFYGALLLLLLFPLIFSAHGIFVNRRNVWASIRDGMQVTFRTLPSTFLLVMVLFMLSEGLDLLWGVPKESSWLAIIGVAGHAFIATGILATTFVYYKDARRYINRVNQQIKFSSM